MALEALQQMGGALDGVAGAVLLGLDGVGVLMRKRQDFANRIKN